MRIPHKQFHQRIDAAVPKRNPPVHIGFAKGKVRLGDKPQERAAIVDGDTGMRAGVVPCNKCADPLASVSSRVPETTNWRMTASARKSNMARTISAYLLTKSVRTLI